MSLILDNPADIWEKNLNMFKVVNAMNKLDKSIGELSDVFTMYARMTA